MANTSENLSWFWLWWALTLGLGVWQLLRAWRQPRELVGFVTVVSVLWLYIYCYLPYHLIAVAKAAFPARIWNLAQFIALVSLLSLVAGWHWKVGSIRQSARLAPEAPVNLDRLWGCGVGALIVGLVGFYTFRISGRDYVSTSAYWYLLFQVSYPGMALCVVVLTLSSRHRSLSRYGTLAVLASLMILPLLAGARRGPTFVAIVALFFPFAIVRSKPVHAGIVLSVLCAAGMLMLLLVTARRVVYSPEGRWMDFLQSVKLEEVLEERAQKTGDNEYYNHCEGLMANLETGLYQYGTAHLAVFLNCVPRSFWPGKPSRGAGLFPEATQAKGGTEGSNLGTGGAWGAAQCAFNNYGYFFPIYWLGIGWLTGTVFLRAQVFGSLRWKLYSVGFLCAAHWFIAQSLTEALVPFMIYQSVFLLAFKFSGVQTGRGAVGPHTTPRIGARRRLQPL